MRIEKYTRVRSEYRDYLKFNVEGINGDIIYIGPYYKFADEHISYKRFAFLMIEVTLLAAVFSIGSGVMRVSGMNTGWQAIPYSFEVIVVLMNLWSAVKTMKYNGSLKYHEYTGTIEKLKVRSVFTMIAAVLGFICIAIFLVRSGFNESVGSTILYLVLRLLVALMGYLVLLKLKYTKWDIQPGIDKSTLDLAPDEMTDFTDPIFSNLDAEEREKLRLSKF